MSKPAHLQMPDDDSRALAQDLVNSSLYAALGVIDPDSGGPFVSRIALGVDEDGQLFSMISALAQHTSALRANPACSLLVGAPGDKGEALSHPRLTLQARAQFVAQASAEHIALRDQYLARNPKATLYASLPDFSFVRFHLSGGFLNAGFGRAMRLAPEDLSQ